MSFLWPVSPIYADRRSRDAASQVGCKEQIYIRDLFPKHHRFRLEIDNSTKLPAYIRKGLGYTFLPASLLQDPAVSTGIRIIPLLDFAPPKIDSYCIMRRDRPLPPDWEDFFLYDKS